MLMLAYYLGLSVVVTGILLQALPASLPPAVTVRAGHNSEGLVLALLLAPWIQFARPRLAGRPREWPVTLAVAATCAAVGGLLVATDLPSRFRTLNEAFLALAVLVPYVQARRPLPRWVPIAVSGAALAAIVLGTVIGGRVLGGTTIGGRVSDGMVDAAEALAVILLAPIAFDLADRRVLDPAAPADQWRYAWYGLLVAAPLAFTLTARGTYLSRVTEAFLFLLLLQAYLEVYRSTPVRTRTRSYV
jgi:hypothetical protein